MKTESVVYTYEIESSNNDMVKSERGLFNVGRRLRLFYENKRKYATYKTGQGIARHGKIYLSSDSSRTRKSLFERPVLLIDCLKIIGKGGGELTDQTLNDDNSTHLQVLMYPLTLLTDHSSLNVWRAVYRRKNRRSKLLDKILRESEEERLYKENSEEKKPEGWFMFG